MIPRTLTCCAAALAAPLSLQAFADTLPPAPAHPNLIIVLADDIGYGEVSCYGQRRFETPNIDALAREGVKFTDFYGAPECSPSRCSLMTGLHSGHERIRANFSYDDRGRARRVGLQRSDQTLPGVLRSAGYATACIGKWGLGEEGTPGIPNDQGFDSFFGFLDDAHAHNYYPEFIWQDRRMVPLPGNYGFADRTYVDDLFMTRTLEFIDRNRDRPFFLYLAPTLPHGKLTPPPGGPPAGPPAEPLRLYDGTPPDKVDPTSPVFAAMVRRFDWDLGRVVARLRELGIDKRTLVVFASDNGPAHVGPTADDTVDVAFFRASGGLRGEKSDVYEGGIRIPCVAWWPGTISPGRVDRTPLAFWDFLPTFADLAGARLSGPTDGISFAPALFGRPQPEHPYLYWEFVSKGQPRVAVRSGRWKADQYGLDRPFELYDLDTDPGESRDIAAEHPDILERLEACAREAHVDDPHFPLRGAHWKNAP